MELRSATPDDLDAVRRIYEPYVLHGLATFEEIPPAAGELHARWTAITKLGLPYLVAEVDRHVVGYSYAAAYRPRPAYRYTVENSVYVAEGHTGRGIGRALLTALIERCEADRRWRQMVAIIGDSGNTASIALHERLGFAQVGTLRSVGFKLGRWVDTVIMQRPLGVADQMIPSDRQAS